MDAGVTSEKKQAVSVCPVTGLPVYTRPSWENINIGEQFSVSFSVTGENILTIRPFGRVTTETVESLIPVFREMITEAFGNQQEFIIIEDFDGLNKVTVSGRKKYLEYYRTLENLKAVVVCSSSPLMHLSIKLGSRFNSWHYDVRIEKSLAEGLKAAMMFLKPNTDDRLCNGQENLPYAVFNSLNGDSDRCPFTGLPILRKPEWTNVDLGGPHITFWVIGGRIIASSLSNWSGIRIKTIRRMFELRRKIIDEVIGPDEKFIEIRDYSELNRGTSRRLRAEFISQIKPDKDRMLGFIGYNAPLSIKISFSVGQRLYSSPFPWDTVNNYNEAVNLALLYMKDSGYVVPKVNTVLRKDEWTMDLNGFKVRYEIVNGDIIHRISSGFLLPEHVEPSYHLQCQVVEEAGLYDKPHYFINNVTGLRGASFKARKKYFSHVTNWVETYHGCRMTVMYGANRMIRASLAISNYLRPYQLVVCDSFEDGLMHIANDKVVMFQGEKRPYDIETQEENLISRYSDELVRFLGNINWELDGYIEFGDSVSQTHPFKTVFDAITLIKSDIDELFRENEKTKLDLEESKKIANVLTQEIIKAQENERQRIARDLHDNVAQDLASLIISNDRLFEGFDDIPHELKRRAMKNSRTLKRAIESIRHLAYDLRPPSLDQLGLVKTLSQYCSDFQETNLIRVDFYSAGVDNLDLDFDTEINIYRVAQEALNNIKKHANASYVTIHLITAFPSIILKIDDDGDGFDLENRMISAFQEKRMGLKSMEERARLLSGEFKIRSLVGKGTTIRLTLPYQESTGSRKDLD